MDEDAFLKGRQERELARAAKQSAEESEDAVASKEFHSKSSLLVAKITQLVADAKVDEAHEAWRELQQLVQSAATTIRLTPHELKNANAKLNDLLAAVDSLRSASKPAKKFAFSSRLAGGGAAGEKNKKPPSATSSPPTAAAGEAVEGADRPSPLSYASVGGSSDSAPTGGVLFKSRVGETIRVAPGRAVFIRECSQCLIYVLPVEGSLFLADCTDCTVYGACFQLRIKSSHRMRFYVATMSTPVIESSDDISFGSYEAWRGLARTPKRRYFPSSSGDDEDTFATHAQWLTEVGGFSNADQQLQGSFSKVDDFHWLRLQQSPNWRVEPPDQYAVSEEVFTEPSNPNEK